MMLYLFLIIFVPTIAKCQIMNRAPHFVPGSGDMARFSLSENTPVGSPVYQLKGNKFANELLRHEMNIND